MQVYLYNNQDETVSEPYSGKYALAAIGLGMLLLAGCASGNKTEAAWQQDRENLQSQLIQVGSSQNTLAEQLQALSKQLAELEARMISHEADQEASFEQNEARFTELGNNIEALNGAVASESRSGAASKHKSQEKAKATKKPVITKIDDAPPPPKLVPVVSDEEIKGIYINAYLALKSGRYAQAAADFDSFLAKFPTSKYTHQAEFWLGETLHAQGNTAQAIEAFQKAANTPEKNPQWNAALLRLGQLYMELGRSDEAGATFLQLIKARPQSAEAETARKILAASGNNTTM